MACCLYRLSFSSSTTYSFSDCSGQTITLNVPTLSGGATYFINANCTSFLPTNPNLTSVSAITESISDYQFVDCCLTFGGNMLLPIPTLLNPTPLYLVSQVYFSDGTILSPSGKIFCLTYGNGIDYTFNPNPKVSAVLIRRNTEITECDTCLTTYPCENNYYINCCNDCDTEITQNCFIGSTTSVMDYSSTYYITGVDDSTITSCYTPLEYPILSGYNMYNVSNYDIDVFSEPFTNCNTCKVVNEICLPTTSPTPTPTTTPTPTPIPKPPLPPKAFDYINECAVITLFPMGVECVITNPSPESSDGSLFLNITGGTPPYTITWEDGNIGPNLYNLTAGTYKAIVTDFYKDFTANTNCTLTGSTPVPSPTPTPTPTPPYVEYNLCMQTSIVKGDDTINEDTPFVPNGILNGRPSWISFDSTSIMYWNAENSNWVVSSSTSSDVIVCANPAYPPIYGSWFILGNGTVYVSSGSCENNVPLGDSKGYSIVIGQPLRLSISANNPICGCDGNITLVANGGTPPYLYTINSGLTYKTFPIFNDLCSGLYSVKVKDSIGLEVDSSITLSSPNRPVTYQVFLNTVNEITSNGSLEKKIKYTSTISVFPELPDGVVLTFDLSHMNFSQTSPNFSSSTFVNYSSLSINGVTQPINIITQTGTTFNVLPSCQDNTTYKTMTMDYWYGIQYTNTTSLILTTVSEIYKNEQTNCYIGLSDETYQISNISINGCYCCNVVAS